MRHPRTGSTLVELMSYFYPVSGETPAGLSLQVDACRHPDRAYAAAGDQALGTVCSTRKASTKLLAGRRFLG